MSSIRDVGEFSFGSLCAPLKALVDETWSTGLMLRLANEKGEGCKKS